MVATASDADMMSLEDISVGDMELSDWDDLNWNENGLYEPEELNGMTYGDLYADATADPELRDIDIEAEDTTQPETSNSSKSETDGISYRSFSAGIPDKNCALRHRAGSLSLCTDASEGA